MLKKLEKYGLFLFILHVFYAFLSYLIFLRDDFILERISVLTNQPSILETGRTLASLLHVNSIPTLLFFISLILMFYFYAKALRVLSKDKINQKKLLNTIFKYSSLCLIATFISFPSLSTDVFDYISSNRVLYEHQANPWLHAPQEFTNDEFIYLGSWKFRASVYGPVQFVFSSVVSFLGRDNIILNIIGFKLINIFFTVATFFLLLKILKQIAPSRAAFGLAVFAWNPLLYIEIIGNAHNDIIMAFFTLLGIYFLINQKIFLSALTISLSILTKMSSALFIPPLIIFLIKNKNRKTVFKFLLTLVIITIVGFATLGNGFFGLVKNLGVQTSLYLRSLPTILRYMFIKIGFTENISNLIEKLFTVPLFLFTYIKAVTKLNINKLFSVLVFTMMAYLIIASPMLQPWYLIWFLPIAALLPPGRLLYSSLTFTFSSLLHYIVLYVSFYFSPLSFMWQVFMFIIIAFPPIAVWLVPKTWYTQIRIAKL